MKKFFRIPSVLILLFVAAAGLPVAFAPRQYTMERSVTINAVQSAVFGAMTNFRTWPGWTA